MAPLAVGLYDLSVFVHVAAAVAGLGATFAESLAFPVAMKLDPRHLPYVHRLQLAINQRLATPALAVILLTGIYQSLERYSLGDPWISGTFVIVIAIGAINGAYFIPTDRRLGVMVERELVAAGTSGPVALSEDYQRGTKREGMVGALTGWLILLAVFLMVVKPG